MKPTVVDFKPLTESDLGLLYDWFHRPHIKKWYTRNKDYTREMITKKYLPRVHHPEQIPNFIISVDDHPIGYIQLYCVSHSLPEDVDSYDHPLFINHKPQDTAGIDMFIAEEEYLGKGYASLVLQKFINDHVKGKFTTLIVDPLKTNRHAIQFFERNRFEKLANYQSQSIHELMVLHVT